MAYEFVAPSFINENDPDTIQERMMKELPADIDNMPGGFPWDFTRPTANEKSELIQFHLVQTLMLMFPQWAWGEWLEHHAAIIGIHRREASYASGKLMIEGETETVIQAGSIFVTPATDSPSVEFRAIEDAVISEQGFIEVDIVAVEQGAGSNVPAKTVTLMSKPISGVTAVYNPAPITGGAEAEDDEALRERVQELNEATSVSFVGSDSDYIRWSKEVPGVGSAVVLPEFYGAGTVKVVLWDANGEPASDYLINAVIENILSPQDRLLRKAPIGATVYIEKPTEKVISYSFEMLLEDNVETENVIARFKEGLATYYAQAKLENVLKYNNISSILINVEGVKDFNNLKINNDIRNISLEADEFPVTGNVEFEILG